MAKRLVLFFDGTWKRQDQGDRASNVIRFMRRVRRTGDDGLTQVVYYDRGVGSGRGLDRWTGGMIGHGLADNVKDAYTWLGNNWNEDDEIFLFGFSRGAFTARSVAGMIGRVGVLGRENLDKLEEAWDTYRSESDERAKRFRKEHTQSDDPPEVHVGVWDTVGSLGIPGRLFAKWRSRKHGFHDTSLGEHVRVALHAVGVDELRKPFYPTLWTKQHPSNKHVEQVWCTGVHSDVGGGYGRKETALSDITLAWMISRINDLTNLSVRPLDEKRMEFLRDMSDLTAPDWTLHDSMAPYYKPLGRRPRNIKVVPGTQSKSDDGVSTYLHPSVRKRWKQNARAQYRGIFGSKYRTPPYGPRNLERVIDSLPDAPRGKPGEGKTVGTVIGKPQGVVDPGAAPAPQAT